ncbi:hypothetical protein ACRDNQ_03925 [Palleronia sp. KMU-117]|uniref:hypothetical protein n=1 Tax=Palleronia sp. KMU-117 TaxID=3434108 RepID=UPI003D756F75
MDVNEVVGLADWLDEHVAPAMSVYEALVAALEQNATNSSRVPLKEHLEAVERELMSMPVEQLTYEQSDLLEAMGVLHLLGKKGWRFIEQTVKEGNYDPATSAQDARKAKQQLDRTLQLFKKARQSLAEVNITGLHAEGDEDKVTVRVRFTEGVEIKNVTQLKKWSGEWYDIARGLAMAVGEKPEDVEVKGASTGSVIIILGTTLTVATIIALIMKQVASTVKSSMEIAHTLQDWKMRKIADAEVEATLKARRERVEKGGVDAAYEEVVKRLDGKLQGDVEAALKKSIDKLFSFTAKGGEVDILPPPVPEHVEPHHPEDDVIAESIETLTNDIEEIRSLKAETQLLIEDNSDDDQEEA